MLSRDSENSSSCIPSQRHAWALGVHKIELVVLENTSAMAAELNIMHTACCTLAGYHRHNGRGLVAAAALEAGEAPVDKLDGVLGLDSDNGGVAILVHNVTTEHEVRSHMHLPWRG